MRRSSTLLHLVVGALALLAGCAHPAAPSDDARRTRPPAPAPTREPTRNEQKPRYAARTVPESEAAACELP